MDYQYWSPNDPQKTPYDDTGWTFPELFNVQAVRVADVKVLDAPIEKLTAPVTAKGGVTNTGSVYLVNHNADVALATLRYTFKDASFEAAEEPFDAAGKKFSRGSFIIKNASANDLQKAAADLGLQIVAVSAAPSVKTHPVRTPRIAEHAKRSACRRRSQHAANELIICNGLALWRYRFALTPLCM
jgi:hypothetical protein